MNERDSESIAGIFEEFSMEKSEYPYLSDYLVFNTCSVRKNADNRLEGNLGILKNKWTSGSYIPKIIVCGCEMQIKETREYILKKFPFIDFVFGTGNSFELKNYLHGIAKQISVKDQYLDFDYTLPVKRKDNTSVLISIMEGCNNFCSYCIVPFTRGREKSKAPKEIIKEAETAIKDGAKTITLLGQNVNSYKYGDYNFAKLLKEVCSLGIKNVKYMTSHPKDWNEEILNCHLALPNLENSVHLPLQSGSTRILEMMNRGYTKEYYLDIIKKIRDAESKIGPIQISTDIMVGFPTESEEDFNETLEVCDIAKFDMAFMFIYSKRPLTKALEFDGDVATEIAKKRFEILKSKIESFNIK